MRPKGLYICVVMKKGESTRQRIIEEAALIFNKKGIAGTSVSDIMEATKLAKGGIYRQFENKEAIVTEAFNFLSKRLINAIDDKIKSQTNAKDKLFAVLDLYHDRLALAENGGCPLLNFGVETDDTDHVIRDRVALGIKSIQDRFARIISEGIQTGEFKKHIDPHEFGIYMFNLLEGTILTSRVFSNKGQMKMVTDMLRSEVLSFLE